MILLVNIGNTNTWIAKYENGLIQESKKISSKLAYRENLELGFASHLYISSLVPDKLNELLELIKEYKNIQYTIIQSSMAKYLRDGAYDFAQLGVDRMLICDAAVKKYGTNILVCDLGTASTLNYINDKSQLEGGLILPGLDLNIRSLADNTGLLKEVSKDGNVSLTAKNTDENIRSGIVLSQVYTIERYAKEHNAKIILTGGNSFYIKDYFSEDYHFDQYLLLEGLVNFVEEK